MHAESCTEKYAREPYKYDNECCMHAESCKVRCVQAGNPFATQIGYMELHGKG